MIANRLVRCAVLYAMLGVSIGVTMGATGDFTNKSLHVHVNLVGWVSMALMAMVYRAYLNMAASRLAAAQFWLHNIGLPIMLVCLYGLLHGYPWGEQFIGIGSTLVALAFLSFAVNVWRNAND